MKYYEVSGYWKDDGKLINDYIIGVGEYVEEDHMNLDEDVFHYFSDDKEVIEAHEKDSGFEFVLTGVKRVYLNWTTDKKDEVETILIRKWTSIGIDLPENYEDIVQFCYEDVCETADERNWSDGDVAIAFRRWIEAQSDD
jgi:hypothetical protein